MEEILLTSEPSPPWRVPSIFGAVVEQQVPYSSLSQRFLAHNTEERLGVVPAEPNDAQCCRTTEAGAMLLERIGPAMRDVTAWV